MAEELKLTWLGHSCFCITYGDHTAVIDPYANVKGYPDPSVEAGEVYASHGHGDHANFDAVHLVQQGKSPFTVTTIDCFHDEEQGALRGTNKITVFEVDGKRIVHFGDLGHRLPEALAEQIRGCEAALIPVGGFYTIDGKTAAEVMRQVDPVVTIPMHYRHGKYGFDEISEVDPFLQAVTDRSITEAGGSDFVVDGQGEHRVVLLQFRETEQ